MGSLFRAFMPAARPPAAAGRTASAALVSVAISRGRRRLPNRPPDLTARRVGGPGGPPTRPAVGEDALWARSEATGPKHFPDKERIHEWSGSRYFPCYAEPVDFAPAGRCRHCADPQSRGGMSRTIRSFG